MAAVDVFTAALGAVLRVLIFGAAGAHLARRNILNPHGRKVLGSAIVDAFLPCLLFSKIAGGGGSIDISLLLCAGFAAYVCAVGFAMGIGLRYLLERMPKTLNWSVGCGGFLKPNLSRGTYREMDVSEENENSAESADNVESSIIASARTSAEDGIGTSMQDDKSEGSTVAVAPLVVLNGCVPRSFRVGLVAAVTFGNSGALPIAIMSAISSSPQFRGDSHVERQEGGERLSDSDAALRVSDYGIQLISIYVSVISALMWGAGFVWMQIAAKVEDKEVAEETETERMLQQEDGTPCADSSSDPSEVPTIVTLDDDVPLQRNSKKKKPSDRPSINHSLPLSSDVSRGEQSRRCGVMRSCCSQWSDAISERYVRLPANVRLVLGNLASPPQISIIFGIIFLAIAPLHRLIFDVSATVSDNPYKAPFGFVGSAIAAIGDATIPCAVFILGANIYEGPGSARLPKRLLLSVLLSRLIVLPAIGLASVILLRVGKIIDPTDKVLQFVLMLESATPSALNLVLMCQLIGRGEKEMATLEFYQYVASIGTITLWSFIFLLLI